MRIIIPLLIILSMTFLVSAQLSPDEDLTVEFVITQAQVDLITPTTADFDCQYQGVQVRNNEGIPFEIAFTIDCRNIYRFPNSQNFIVVRDPFEVLFKVEDYWTCRASRTHQQCLNRATQVIYERTHDVIRERRLRFENFQTPQTIPAITISINTTVLNDPDSDVTVADATPIGVGLP